MKRTNQIKNSAQMTNLFKPHFQLAAVIICFVSNYNLSAQTHYGDSPWAPPIANSSRFVVDQGPYLDTGCTFRSGGPLLIDIPVTLAYNQVISTLEQNGTINSYATLSMPAWDVDYYGGGSGVNPERDQVWFIGKGGIRHLLSPNYLTGDNNIWAFNSFKVPIDWINFPDPAPAGGTVTPAINTVEIDIDTMNTSEVWCCAIDWVALDLGNVPLPNVFVHGIRSDGGTWDQQTGTDSDGTPVTSFIKSFRDIGLIADNNLNMGSWDTIEDNANKIQKEVDKVCAQYGVSKVNLICHSKGGLDARQYAEFAAGDKVFQLIQMGTPNAGSPLADWAMAHPILAYPIVGNPQNAPALSQLSTHYMAMYNRFHGYNHLVSYRAIAGKYTPGEGRFDDIMEKFLLSLAGPGDTIVPLTSVYSTQTSFIVPLPAIATAGPNHQARHASLPSTAPMSMTCSPMFIHAVLPFGGLEPQARSKTTSSLVDDASILSIDATTPEGGVTNVVPVDESRPLTFAVTYPTGQLSIALVAPNGQRFSIANSLGNTNLVFTNGLPFFSGWLSLAKVITPMVGSWKIEIVPAMMPQGSNAIPYFLDVSLAGASSSLTVAANPTSVFYAQPVSIVSTLATGTKGLTNAAVVATVVAPGNTKMVIPLHDDGTNGDSLADDGIYSAIYTNTFVIGNYEVLVDARRTSNGGQPALLRHSFTAFTVSRPQLHLMTPITAKGEDTDGDGLYNWLVITVPLSVTNAGTYTVYGKLTDKAGNAYVASGQSDLSPGLTNVILRFYGNDIRDKQVNGPYFLSSLRLAMETNSTISPQLDINTNIYATTNYNYLQFQGTQLSTFGNPVVQALDTNSNGLYDQLVVTITVYSAVSDTFNGSLQLMDTNSSLISVASVSTYLNAGTNTVAFIFNGTDIGAFGVDGPWYVRNLLLYGTGGTSITAPDVVATTNFLASQFEGFVGPANTLQILNQNLTSTNVDKQTGLFYQQVMLTNTGPSAIDGIQLAITNLPLGVVCLSATGTNAWGPFVDFAGSIAAGQTLTLTLLYYDTNRVAPVGVQVFAQATAVTSPATTAGTILPVRRAFMRPDQKMAVEFDTLYGRTYVVQYSSDLTTWKEAAPAVIGNGTTMTWIDAGPPSTESNPTRNRFYQIILLPK